MSSRNFRAVPPPSNLNRPRSSYTRSTDIHSQAEAAAASSSGVKRSSKFHSEDDYFDHDDDDFGNDPIQQNKVNNNDDDDDEEDPLDAFMADLAKSEKKTKNPEPTPMKMSTKESVKDSRGVRADLEEEDAEESYYRYMEKNPNAGVGSFVTGSDDEAEYCEYDEDGNPIPSNAKRQIDPLPMIYHSEITYPKFEKNFYNEHEEIAKLSVAEVVELRRKLGIRVSGPSAPKPVTSFAHFNFDEQLLKTIRKLEYTQPTPIQAQAIPAALSGRDLIGIAKTGSGKTAAFIWPLIVHIMDQPELKKGDGPIGVILAPTRELSQQIYTEAKRFAKSFGINVVCAYGGGSKYEQAKDLEQGAEIIVATPGRMIDFVKMKATNFLRCTYLVLDEADRMFDMGFEVQVRSICNHVRPDRQTLMFSATFKKKIEKLARDVLSDPIRIVQGEIGNANQDITQVVHVFKAGTSEKFDWLIQHLVEFTAGGSLLIFVTRKQNAQELCTNVEQKTNFHPLLLHGDMNQMDRNSVISSFKRAESPILIATDVAARGLDIPHIRMVINYDVALDIDTHTHRIGRTGRAGEHGVAITLVSEKDKEFVGHLVRNLESANQTVPDELMALAMQSQWFRKSRFHGGKGKQSSGRSRAGLGSNQSASPGLSVGSSNISSSSTYSGHFVPSSTSFSSTNTSGSAEVSSTQTNDRLSIMRQAYKAQFRSQFTSATDTAWSSGKNSSNDQGGSSKKKSRWG